MSEQIGDTICNFVAFYRSASQSQYNFETYADNIDAGDPSTKIFLCDNSHWWL